MPVDKQILEQCIAEAAGDDKEMADFLRTRYAANDALAVKFVGGFTRTADYSRKRRRSLTNESSSRVRERSSKPFARPWKRPKRRRTGS